MTTAAADPKAGKNIRLYGILVLVAGIVFIVAGGITWFVVRDQLVAENITVSEDAARFGGRTVAGPFTAYAQAEIINKHALEASGGATYAELDREDPARETMMNASFLRASLFTSVVAFGVAAMAGGLGLVLILVGLALLQVAKSYATVTPGRDPAPAV